MLSLMVPTAMKFRAYCMVGEDRDVVNATLRHYAVL